MTIRDLLLAGVVLVVVVAFIVFGLNSSDDSPETTPDATVTEQTSTVTEP